MSSQMCIYTYVINLEAYNINKVYLLKAMIKQNSSDFYKIKNVVIFFFYVWMISNDLHVNKLIHVLWNTVVGYESRVMKYLLDYIETD